MLKFDKVIKCWRGVVILHDTLLVVYDVTKLVQHCHAKVIEVKKAFRSCDLTSFIEFSRVLEYILMNSMEIYFCTKLVRTVCNSAMAAQCVFEG